MIIYKKVMESGFVRFDAGAWTIDPEAPQHLKDEFVAFMDAKKQMRDNSWEPPRVDPDE